MSDDQKIRIWILVDWFVPGYQAGGPIQSVLNFGMALKNRFEIKVVTTAFDHGSDEPYPDLPLNQWTSIEEGLEVFYFDKASPSRGEVFSLLDKGGFDYLYLQSMFSPAFTLFPLIWQKLRRPKSGIVLAPRGMLHAGALRYSSLKKRLVLAIMKGLGLMKGVKFQATDEQESRDIKAQFGVRTSVRTVGNLPKQTQEQFCTREKKPGEVRFIFTSRVHPKKNLEHLLELLPRVNGTVVFDIYGPREDEGYVANLEEMVSGFPEHIEVEFKGGRPPKELHSLMGGYHFSVLPTHGENFGHSIFEAFLSGLPVIISDQTPWLDLENKQIGWAIPLEDKAFWLGAVQQAIDMDQNQYELWSRSAWQFARDYNADPLLVEQAEDLFIS